MSKGYIYNEDGELEDIEDYSCEGSKVDFCPFCNQDTVQYIDCFSMVNGYIWICSKCEKRIS